MDTQNRQGTSDCNGLSVEVEDGWMEERELEIEMLMNISRGIDRFNWIQTDSSLTAFDHQLSLKLKTYIKWAFHPLQH